VDVNHQDSFGTFALGIASREGHADLVRLLGQCEADVNLQDKEGVCSLMEATSSGMSSPATLQSQGGFARL
jgi:ankyrin repeat protein